MRPEHSPAPKGFKLRKFLIKMPKVITVFGASGGQGGGVVSAVLKAINSERKDYAVRTITRNPDGAKGQELKSKGCEVVKCDLDDK